MFKFKIGERVNYDSSIYLVKNRRYRDSIEESIVTYDIIRESTNCVVKFVNEKDVSKLSKYKIVITKDGKEVYSEYSDHISYDREIDKMTFGSETTCVNYHDVITIVGYANFMVKNIYL